MDEGHQSKQSQASDPPDERKLANPGIPVPSKSDEKPFVAAPDGTIDLPGLPESSLPGIPMTRLQDKYEFLTVLGAGGAGVIYKARQQPLERLVAVKMIHSHLMSPTAVKRFHQEARTISRLSHPNIITVFDFGISEERQPFMVMDYVEGTPLNEIIQENGTLSLSLTNEIARQVCDGMMHAHAQGILHRDLKPSNIMIVTLAGGQHLVKVLDFGLAKILVDDEADLEHLTMSGETVGTPAYMSPEQAMGKSLDQRSDIYSLGCVMYHCLTGTPPFVGETNMDTMLKQLNNAPLPINNPDEAPKVPPPMEALIMCLLDKNPDNRIQSMLDLKDLIRDLEANPQGELIGAGAASRAGGLITGTGDFKSGTKARATTTGGDSKPTDSASTEGSEDISHDESSKTESGKIGESSSKSPTILIAVISVLVLGAFVLFLATALHDPLEGQQKSGATPGKKKAGKSRNEASDNEVSKSTETDDTANNTVTKSGTGDLDEFGDHRIMYKIDKDFNVTNLEGDKYVTDAGLDRIAQMPYLQSLNLDNSKITNRGIQKLEGAKFSNLSIAATKVDGGAGPSFTKMPHLKSLNAAETALDDKGVTSIASLPQLSQLNLDGTKITDGCSDSLAKAKNLELLSLKNTKIGDTTASAIARLSKLSKLNLAGTAIGDNGAKEISKLSRLSNLNLESTRITNKTVPELTKMPALLEVNLSNTRITDGSVDSLCKLEGLQRLYLMNCKLTRNAITRFQRKNPSCILVMTPTEEER